MLIQGAAFLADRTPCFNTHSLHILSAIAVLLTTPLALQAIQRVSGLPGAQAHGPV